MLTFFMKLHHIHVDHTNATLIPLVTFELLLNKTEIAFKFTPCSLTCNDFVLDNAFRTISTNRMKRTDR